MLDRAQMSLRPSMFGDLIALSSKRYAQAGQRIEGEPLPSHEQITRPSAHLEAAREEERRHIAMEIHDELGQLLTALRMDVSLLEMQPSMDPPVMQKLGEMRELVERAMGAVRNVVNHLRPVALNYGIVPALQWLTASFSQRNSAVCRLQVRGPEPSLDDSQATLIFRIAQESLTNVSRHAAASEVSVKLISNTETITLEICDNGCGFDMAHLLPDSTFGLLGMSERAHALGTTLRIRSAPNAGTTISVMISQQPDRDRRKQTSGTPLAESPVRSGEVRRQADLVATD